MRENAAEELYIQFKLNEQTTMLFDSKDISWEKKVQMHF